MKFDISTLISVASFLGGVGTTLLGVGRWHSDTQRKKFAAEREFEHLKRDHATLSAAVAHIDDRLEELFDYVVEMRGAVSVVLKQQGGPDLPKLHTEKL
jgi:hypothetical protein